MKIIRKLICLGVMISISVGILSACGDSKLKTPEHVFAYAENQPDDYPATKAAYKFAELVKEKTGGRIEILVKSDGQMGDEEDVLAQMEFGGVDFTRVSLSSLSDKIPELSVLMMPYLYSSEESMWKVLNGDIGNKFFDDINNKDQGIIALSWFNAGTRNFYSVKPIESIGDLSGLNIRVQESGIMADLVRALGANPIQMAYSEVTQGLRTRKIDGAENNWSSYEYSGHYENAKYCIVDEHTRIPEVQLISDIAWQSLSEEDKNIIRQCSSAAAAYERELWNESEENSKIRLLEKGVKIVEITDEEKLKVQSEVSVLYDKYCAQYMDIVQKIRGLQ